MLPSRSAECSDAGDVAADDKGLDGFGALERVDGLKVGHVPDDVVVEQDAVAAEQVAGVGEDRPALLVLCSLARPASVGVSWPTASSLAIWMQYSCMAVTSASIRTSRCWMIWKLASGWPNWGRRLA